MEETRLFADTSQYLCRGSLQLKYREKSLLPLCLDVLLVGGCTQKFTLTLKLLHTGRINAGTMSTKGEAFVEVVAIF